MKTTKVCTKCNEEKSLDDFFPRNEISKRTGLPLLRGECKKCYNKEHLKLYRLWASKNPDKVKARQQRYYDKYKNDPEFRKQESKRAKERKKRRPEAHMLVHIRASSKLRGLEFNLSESDIIIPEFCPLTGLKLVLDNVKVENNSPTIDRIDNSRGYVPGNVRVISYLANVMKNSATYEQMEIFVKNILPYMRFEI